MPEPITAVVDSITKAIGAILSPRIAVTVFIVACILLGAPLLLPGTWVDSLLKEHKVAIGLCWLFSGVLTSTHVVSRAWTNVNRWHSRRRSKRAVEIRLTKLTTKEKHVLQLYLECSSKTFEFRIDNGVVMGLAVAGVLYAPTTVRNAWHTAFNLSDVAWEYLTKHPDIVATPDDPRPPPSSLRSML